MDKNIQALMYGQEEDYFNPDMLISATNQLAPLQSLRQSIAGYEQSLQSPQNINPLLAIVSGASDIFSGTQFTPGLQQQKQINEKEFKQGQKELINLKANLAKQEMDLFKAQYQDALGRERLAQEENLLKMRLGAETGKTPELKDWQVQSATYGKRLAQAEDVFNQLSGEGYDRATTGEGIAAFFQRGPFEQLKGDQLKRQEQAERNFITATLRKESGAAISQSEFANAEKQYFPRAGDTPEVLAQKAANRRQVIEGMKLGAGPAWQMIGTVPGASAPAKAPPAVGEVRNGFKFKGGNPADKNSWEKQ